ncbi:MAG TPA: hypothetical protein VM689_00195 [Aliidongia sp.]|nr:hypothetical protein [Aliidongia sp.]
MELNRESAATAHTQPADPNGALAESRACEDRTEQDVRRLEELVEIGMDLVRSVRQRALDPEGGLGAGEAAKAFADITKSIRQTMALKNKLIEDRERQTHKRAHDAEWAERSRRMSMATARRDARARLVKRAVRQVIERDVRESDVEDLLTDLNEWLGDEDIEADLADRPIGKIIARICRGLGVEPDWRLWENEAWAIEERRGAAGTVEPPQRSPFTGRWFAGAGIVEPPEPPSPRTAANGSDPPRFSSA